MLRLFQDGSTFAHFGFASAAHQSVAKTAVGLPQRQTTMAMRKIRVIEQSRAINAAMPRNWKTGHAGSIAGQLKSEARKVGRKKDTCHHEAHASVENAHSATPFGISRRVFGRAFEVEWLAHCCLSARETLATSFGKVARYPASGRKPNCRCGVVWVDRHCADCDK